MSEERKQYVTKSEIAKATHLKPISILFYLKQGLIKPAKKTDSGYFLFDKEETIRRIQFIKILQEENYSLKDILEILKEKDKKLKDINNDKTLKNNKFILLKDIAKIIPGVFIPTKWTSKKETNLPIVSITYEIHKIKLTSPINKKYLLPEYKNKIPKEIFLQEKDIVLSSYLPFNATPKLIMIDKKFKNNIAGNNLIILRFKEDSPISREFLSAFFEFSEFIRKQLDYIAQGKIIRKIFIKDLSQIKIPITNKKERDLIENKYKEKKEIEEKLLKQLYEIELKLYNCVNKI